MAGSDLGLTAGGAFKTGEDFSLKCMSFDPANDYLLSSVDCNSELMTVCVKPVCPTGFEFFNNDKCVKLVTTNAAKAAADTTCQTGKSSSFSQNYVVWL